MTILDKLDTIEKLHRYIFREKGLKIIRTNPQNENLIKLLINPHYGEALPEFELIIDIDVPGDTLLILEFSDRKEEINKRRTL